ncbi:hypothetical protein ECANGB1_1864 [Enterospora canceri]|uniref:Pyrimidine 5'-nucleotidase n=1 Tax=Enterospora canceri TaxID=1081671 RepID=A0A1Y1S622_9MICR|nr:hypothetical protein ECANGB1_1864 [Enterospora canceri]
MDNKKCITNEQEVRVTFAQENKPYDHRIWHGITPAHYVQIASRNAHLRLNVKAAEDEHIFVFDMDQCIYHCDDLVKFDRKSALNHFIKLTKMTESDFDKYESYNDNWMEMFVEKFSEKRNEICCVIDSSDYRTFLSKCNEVNAKLDGLKFRKFLFTNGTKCRTQNILNLIGLEHAFEKVFCADIDEHEHIIKPKKPAFEFVQNHLQAAPKMIHFFDDNPKNIKGARELGWNVYEVKNNLLNQIETAIDSVGGNQTE